VCSCACFSSVSLSLGLVVKNRCSAFWFLRRLYSTFSLVQFPFSGQLQFFIIMLKYSTAKIVERCLFNIKHAVKKYNIILYA
jgi:hypothetical protein